MCEQVLPFYVVCDESYSMANHIDALNEGLRELHHAVGADPVAAGKTMFCLIGFSGTAEVLQPLARLGEVTEIAGLTAKASTSFGAAFSMLRDTIERDVEQLKRDQFRVYRPAVFFLSDGQPTDPKSWHPKYDRLTEPGWPARPDIVAFGIGDADATLISRIATSKAFMSRDGVNPRAALYEFARALTKSMVDSGTSLAGLAGGGEVALRVPEQISGYTPLWLAPSRRRDHDHARGTNLVQI